MAVTTTDAVHRSQLKFDEELAAGAAAVRRTLMSVEAAVWFLAIAAVALGVVDIAVNGRRRR